MNTPVTAKCKHTDQPLSYMKWHCWAEKKQKTHRQRKCPHCGLWAIWLPKPVKPAEKGGGEEVK